ncbi:aminotransferase class I/II-fold pyridoxal phosphate-dependent enzyme [Kitasatospora aureofaciens]|uniref:GntR family transcriptional regulator n=1 Tax=Kitasatospora aureofaciens TaxID=1894 RepID=A0A8H9HR38_KITAU|nr:aminotransferase class I/II-fold pyridoxal phosphate-dependent enzyme [Kitasatospora aureofaciens]ARF82101.1 GntR family transcriptional regulator [Kitasatospora aureofaciens]QEU98638.1 aminotransferase class I/II-fold pyridoxal phosphate-dependent enzyme [Streptomyces viridifaciens]UKZ04605.1 aminotransferase class I/II-fold pyridoxal phosphate-dependent enzyme [Streptomyces viridifaciens]GGU84547.1 GntR family transcriptional regulator [Kitasatospora aureofaciens]
MLGDYPLKGRRASEIAAHIEQGVSSGQLAPGTALPPLRDLAAELGVNPNTVAAAYRLLRDRGVIETAGRKGSRILPRPALTPRDLIRIPVPAQASDLSTGNPDPALLPDLGPALAAAAEALRAEPVLYGHPRIDAGLLDLARTSFEADGLHGPIAVASGALDTVERALGAWLRPGDAVAVEDPGWGSLLDLLPAMGLRPEPVRLDDQGLLPDSLAAALAEGARAVVVTSRAQNPTGAALTARRAAALRAVLAGHPGVLLIEDDHGHGMVDQPYHPLVGAGPRHWAVVRSAAKAYGPDLRVSVMVGDEETVGRVAGRLRLGAGWVSHLLQRTVAELWRTDAAPAASVAAAYRTRREALLGELAARGIEAHGVSGLNVWVPVPDETSALAALVQRGWVAAPGARYRIQSPPGLRFTAARLEAADARRLAEDLAEVLGSGGGGSRLV